ncbi:MAG: citrate/2-methylcitrate synthase [Eubacterium sp.]|nr:citrate/2-methylcitrate synthase [Eubacterium sp.]
MMELDAELDAKLDKLVTFCKSTAVIDRSLYYEYDVKRGLRDANGKGVLTGLTEVSDVVATTMDNGVRVPSEGHLYYWGYDVNDLLNGRKGKPYKFEEATYLLLFGNLPSQRQLTDFVKILTDLQELSSQFVRDVIMKAPSENIMNALQKSIVMLYSYDENPEDDSIRNILRQSLQLIAKMPLIAVYAYHAYRHFVQDHSLLIRNPKPEYSTAQNILRMLRPDGEFTETEAEALDTALVLHMEHGGGNNSTFTTRVVTSSRTDTYSSIAAAIASLKGPRHGGANLKVLQMFDAIKENVSNWEDEEELTTYLKKILNKETFDKQGLIYGMGHAVYTLSDPRAVILKESTKTLAQENDLMDEFALYEKVEEISRGLLTDNRHLFKPICANVDFYSGFLYSMLGIPRQLLTPMFAIARISGWSAHRIEEVVNNGKIIRPAYKYVGVHREYKPIKGRKAAIDFHTTKEEGE